MTCIDDLFKHGGPHLGTVRRWIQCRFTNGSDVRWGSTDRLGNTWLTVLEMEALAEDIKNAIVDELRSRIMTEWPKCDCGWWLTPGPSPDNGSVVILKCDKCHITYEDNSYLDPLSACKAFLNKQKGNKQ